MGIIQILKGEQPGILQTLFHYRNAGQFGEFATEYALKNSNLKGEFIILKNAYIPMMGKSTEIDLIMIHQKGIFVFESKNYSGYIFGNADDVNWVQLLENGSKHIFYNPIKQNNTHILALSDYLSIPSNKFVSYIVFSDRCKLKRIPKNTNNTVILPRRKMLKSLRKLLKKRNDVYTKEQIKAIEKQLKPLTKVPVCIKKQHIKYVRKKHESMICPFCGSKLIRRNGRYGEFIGCTSYPKCKYTREIDR